MNSLLAKVWPWSAIHEAREAYNLAAQVIAMRDEELARNVDRYDNLRRAHTTLRRHADNLEQALKAPVLNELSARMGKEIARAGTEKIFELVMRSAANDNADGDYFTVHIPKWHLMAADHKSIVSRVLEVWERHGQQHAEVNILEAAYMPAEEQVMTTIEVVVPRLAYRQMLKS